MIRTVAATLALVLAACGSSNPAPADLAVSAYDLASSSDLAGADLAGVDLATAAGDLASCMPPTGATCPTTAGNCKGIGKPCTAGGGQCQADGNSCDKDLDSSGEGVCIKPFGCAPNMHQCGAGATCCQTPMTSNFPVCIANACLPSDCTPE